MGWVSLVSCIVMLFASLTKMLGYIAAFLMTEICIKTLACLRCVVYNRCLIARV